MELLYDSKLSFLFLQVSGYWKELRVNLSVLVTMNNQFEQLAPFSFSFGFSDLNNYLLDISSLCPVRQSKKKKLQWNKAEIFFLYEENLFELIIAWPPFFPWLFAFGEMKTHVATCVHVHNIQHGRKDCIFYFLTLPNNTGVFVWLTMANNIQHGRKDCLASCLVKFSETLSSFQTLKTLLKQ